MLETGVISMKRIEMVNKIYGSLLVLEKYDVYLKHDTRWRCKCKCGNETIVRGSFLRNGHTRSCGRCNRYDLEDMYMRCTVKSGRSFLFDSDDFELISQYLWSIDKGGYVLGIKNGERVRLHRLLMDAPKHLVVDHMNGDPSDCRRENLRLTTQHKNTYNSSKPKTNTTGFKGVYFDKRRGKYLSSIHPSGRTVFLGYYDKPEEAAQAYDRAASFYFGEYAKTNSYERGSEESR